MSLTGDGQTQKRSKIRDIESAAANNRLIAPDGRRKARILMVCARYRPLTGGVETHVFETSRRIAEAGYHVCILTTDTTGELPERERLGGIGVFRAPAWPQWSDIRFAPSIYREIVGSDFDLVHVQGYNTLVAPIAMMAALRRGKPFVVSFHSGGHSSRLRNLLRGVQYLSLRPLVRRAAQLIGVSQFEVDFFSRSMGIERDRFEIVPNGGELPRPKMPPTRPSGQPLILSIGRLERYKGHQKAIEAMPHLLQRAPGARLRIVGFGPYEKALQNLVARLGLNQTVVIAGVPPAERAAMAGLIASAALVVLFSDYEAHPVAVAEALALGCPVLANDNSGFREMIQRGWIRGAPTEAAPEARAKLILDALGNESKPIDVCLPTWDDCVDRLLGIYRRVLSAA